MDISVLQVFIEVFRQGSFAAIAKERQVDPSSISRSISSLEKELGVRLFQRTTRKLSPTEAGTIYFNRIEPLVEEMLRAVDQLKDISERPKGILRVTASVSFGLKCVIPFLAEFEAIYPDISLYLLLTDSRLDLLTEKIDLAIRLGTLEDSTFIAQKLMSTKYWVCASPSYLREKENVNHPQDITKHDCLLFPFSDFRTHWIFRNSQGEITTISVKGRNIISSAVGLQQCAIAGMGLALLPQWLINEDLAAGTLVKVLPDYDVTAKNFQTSAWLVYPSRTYIPLKVRVFMDFLKQRFK